MSGGRTGAIGQKSKETSFGSIVGRMSQKREPLIPGPGLLRHEISDWQLCVPEPERGFLNVQLGGNVDCVTSWSLSL